MRIKPHIVAQKIRSAVWLLFFSLLSCTIETALINTQAINHPKTQQAEELTRSILHHYKISQSSSNAFEVLKQTSYEQQDVILCFLLRMFMNPDDNHHYSTLIVVITYCEKLLERHECLKVMLEKHLMQLPDFDSLLDELSTLYTHHALPPKLHSLIRNNYVLWKGTIWWSGKNKFIEKLH